VANKALELLFKTPYMRGKNEDQLLVQLTNMLQRIEPTELDLKILRGMFRKVTWAINNGNPNDS
jgi:tRNA C32,U32 (ribose-2'-O)-methylase TrmJ